MGIIKRTTDEINTLLDKVANLPEEGTGGKDGKTPVLETGSTTTLEAGEPATSEVVRDGEDSSGNPKYIINFGIPKGQDGTSGGGVADSVEWSNVLNKPIWVTSSTKPSYTASEVGAIPKGGLKTINGQSLEGEGNIEISGSGSGIPDAPADNEIYGRKNNNWEKIVSEQQYLDLSMFVGESGTLSDEDYQKVIDAYNNKTSIFALDMNGEKLKVHGLGIVDADVCYMIFFSFSLNYPQPVASMSAIIIDKDTKDYTYKTDTIPFEISGNGTKALADNGQYVEFIPEAPANGKTYGRKNKSWVEIVASGMQVFDATELVGLMDAGESDLSSTLKDAIASAYESKTAFAETDETLYLLMIKAKDTGYDLTIQASMPYDIYGMYYVPIVADVNISTNKITVTGKALLLTSSTYVPNVSLDDYKKASSYTAIVSSDSIISAIAKLEAGISQGGGGGGQISAIAKLEAGISQGGGGGGQQYLDLSMFTGDTGTLSDEDYQKVVDAYNNKISIGYVPNSGFFISIQNDDSEMVISGGKLGTFAGGGSTVIQSILIVIKKSDKSYSMYFDFLQTICAGTGTKALTDNGQYAAFASEAPKDGKAYVRKNGEWVDITTV